MIFSFITAISGFKTAYRKTDSFDGKIIDNLLYRVKHEGEVKKNIDAGKAEG